MATAAPALYTSINDYLNANQGTVANEQGAIAGRVGGELDAAKAGDDQFISGVKHGDNYSADAGYGDAKQKEIAATQDATTLGQQGGVANLLKQQYAAPNYTQDAANWDAGLVGHPASFDALQAQGKTLSGYLDAGAGKAATPLPPGPADTGPAPKPRGPSENPPADNPPGTAWAGGGTGNPGTDPGNGGRKRLGGK